VAMRQLLMAGMGAAGFLVINLPALGQLSNDTSTFNGVVASSCSIARLGELNTMALSSLNGQNKLYAREFFVLSSNVNVRLMYRLSVIKEPEGFASSRVATLGVWPQPAGMTQTIGSNGTGKYLNATFSPGANHDIFLDMEVTNALPGTYEYVVTVSCML